MASDNLFLILGAIRSELPEVSDETWNRLQRMLADQAGGNRVYVPLNKKRSHLEVMAEMGAEADAQQIAKMLGVSVRRARQLKQLT